jgi:flagellin-like protein
MAITTAPTRAGVRRRRLYRGREARGIAEIVGTLMLILIVVAAAIALAAFIASYQKQLQAEEAQSQQRSLESLKILSITPVLNVTMPDQWASFSFVLASEYINPSGILSISVNGQPLHFFWVRDLSAPGGGSTMYDSTNSTDTLTLTAREEVVVTVNLTASDPYFSMFDSSFALTTTDYVQLSVYTALQNTFTTVFLPPTAIAFVTTLTSYTTGGPIQLPVLDGTDSFQPGANGTIVDWSWSVTESTSSLSNSAGCTLGPLQGSEYELQGASTSDPHFYNATLTVTGTDGLDGETTLPFTSYIEACP